MAFPLLQETVDAAALAPLHIHDLRHTAVSLWIAAGASPREIVHRAGQTSVSIVLDRYGHLRPGSENRVNDELDRLAPGCHSCATPGRNQTIGKTPPRFNRSLSESIGHPTRTVPINVVRLRQEMLSHQDKWSGRRGTRTPGLSRVKAAL